MGHIRLIMSEACKSCFDGFRAHIYVKTFAVFIEFYIFKINPKLRKMRVAFRVAPFVIGDGCGIILIAYIKFRKVHPFRKFHSIVVSAPVKMPYITCEKSRKSKYDESQNGNGDFYSAFFLRACMRKALDDFFRIILCCSFVDF